MSKNKKSRIAKGLGASALAVATLASGLSFGAAASAAPAEPKLGASIGEIDVVFKAGDMYDAPTAAARQTNSYGQANLTHYREYKSLAQASAASRYAVLPSSTDSGKFALEKGGKCLAIVDQAVSASGWVGPSYNSSFDYRWTPEPAYNTGSVPHLAPAKCVDAHFSYKDGGLTYDGRPLGLVGAPKSNTYDRVVYGWPVSGAGGWTSSTWALYGYGLATSGAPLAGDVEAIKPKALSADWKFQNARDERSIVSGIGTADSDIVVKDAAGKTTASTQTAKDGAYSVEIDAPNKGGSYALTVEQTDSSGAKTTKNVELDYGMAVAVNTPADGSEQDAGSTTISGDGENGSSVTVSVNGRALPATTVADGQWSVQGDLRRGENTIVATQKSKGANTTTSTVVVNPGQDGTELPAPTAQVVFPENVEQRAVANGTGAAGASIEIFDGEKKVGSATVGQSGTWTSQLVAVSNGVHTLTIKQTLGDKTNEASVQADYGTELTVNTPAAVKDSSEVTLTGAGTPGAKIEFRDNTGTVRMTRVAADGTWSLAGNFRPDTTTVTVSSVSKGAVVVRKDTTIDVSITTRALTVTSPTQDDADNDRIKDGTVSFTGTATPFATVQFATWPDGLGREVFTTYADANGNWKATGWLAKSYYKLSGVQYAVGGDITRYNMFPFSTVAFQALNVEGPTQGDVVIGGVNTFTGTATPGATVEIKRKDTGQVIARGTAEGEKGIFNAKTDLRVGVSYQLEAVQTALTGKTDTVDLGTITPVASHPITDLAFTHNGNVNDANNITFTFTAQPGADVSVWTGAKEEAGDAKPWIRQMAAGTADKYGQVKISGYAAVNNPYNLKVYAGTQVVDFDITTTPTK